LNVCFAPESGSTPQEVSYLRFRPEAVIATNEKPGKTDPCIPAFFSHTAIIKLQRTVIMIGLKFNQMVVWVLLAALLAACGTAPPADQGAIEYEQGRYDQAAAEWGPLADDGNYIAQHNLGGLSRYGLGSTSENLEEAAGWFYASAIQGYVPAMVSLAEVQTELGFDDSAEGWLLLAARWGNVEAIEHLKQKGVPVPEADLYGKQVDEQTLERLQSTSFWKRPGIGVTQPLGITDK
jgi:hypothetical protein